MKEVRRRSTYHLTMLALCSMLAPVAVGESFIASNQGNASEWQCIASLHDDWQCKTDTHQEYTHTLESVTETQPHQALSANLIAKPSGWQCISQPEGDWKCRDSTQATYKHSLEQAAKQKLSAIEKTQMDPKQPVSNTSQATAHGTTERVAKSTINELEVLQQEIKVLSEELSLLRKPAKKKVIKTTLPAQQDIQASPETSPSENEHLDTVDAVDSSTPGPEKVSETKTLELETETIKEKPVINSPTQTSSWEAQLNTLERSFEDKSAVSEPHQNILPTKQAKRTPNTTHPIGTSKVLVPKTENTPSEGEEKQPTPPAESNALENTTVKRQDTFEHLLAKVLASEEKFLTEKPAIVQNAIASNKYPHSPQFISTPTKRPEPLPSSRNARHNIARLLMTEQMSSEPPFSTKIIESIKKEHALHPAKQEASSPKPPYSSEIASGPRYSDIPRDYRPQPSHQQAFPQREILASSPYYQATPESIQIPEQTASRPNIRTYQPDDSSNKAHHQPLPQSPPKHYSYRQHEAHSNAASQQQKKAHAYYRSPAISAKDMLDHMKASKRDHSDIRPYDQPSITRSHMPTQLNADEPLLNSAQRLQTKAKRFESMQQSLRKPQKTPDPYYPKNAQRYNMPSYVDQSPIKAAPRTVTPSPPALTSSILNHPPHYFTLQWAASTQRNKLEQLRQRYTELMHSEIIASTSNNQLSYLLVNGTFQNMHTALSSLRNSQWSRLATLLNPWARTIGSLKMLPTHNEQQVTTLLPQGGYTIQWATSQNIHDIKKIKQHYPQLINATILQLSHPQRETQYILTEGTYSDRLTAIDALSQPRYMTLAQQLQPKARPMASLKHAGPISIGKMTPSNASTPYTTTERIYGHHNQSAIKASTYTIQWLASTNPSLLTNIQRRYPELHNAVIINNKNQYSLIQGSFNSASEARQALSQPELQPAVNALTPWIRSTASLENNDRM